MIRSDKIRSNVIFEKRKHKTNINIKLAISTGNCKVIFKGLGIKQPPENLHKTLW